MEKRTGWERTRAAEWQRNVFDWKRSPRNLCWLLFLFSLATAQAASFQLLSVESASISAKATNTGALPQSQLSESFGRLPLVFEAADSQSTRFICRGPGARLWISPAEAVLEFTPAGKRRRKGPGVELFASSAPEDSPEAAPLRIQLIGANHAARAIPLDELPTKTNYFIGNNPAGWRTQVPTFGKVRYQAVYPGIDLIY